jgi:hypothetical protein
VTPTRKRMRGRSGESPAPVSVAIISAHDQCSWSALMISASCRHRLLTA